MKSLKQSPILFPLLIVWALAASSCASRKAYNSIEKGKFEGNLNLQWIAPDKFVFIPNPQAPFKFVRSNGEIIQPEAMYTDGGSMPKAVQSLPNLSSMGYAPAYVIHDWLHIEHTKNIKNGESCDIKLSATILAEGIKTLMEEDNSIQRKPMVFNSIYQMMKTPFAEYAAHITTWHSDLPPAEEVSAMGARFYSSSPSSKPALSTQIAKEKWDKKALVKVFSPHLLRSRVNQKTHTKQQNR